MIITLSSYLQVRYVLEDERVADSDLFFYLIIHRIDVRLIDRHTLLGQRRRVVDRDVMKLWMVAPILI